MQNRANILRKATSAKRFTAAQGCASRFAPHPSSLSAALSCFQTPSGRTLEVNSKSLYQSQTISLSVMLSFLSFDSKNHLFNLFIKNNLITTKKTSIMKKIFLLASIAVMVMTGCSKNQIVEETSNLNEIGFETFLHKSTKASESTVSTLKTTASLPIVAYLNNKADNSAKEFIKENILYTVVEGAGKWDTAITRYWPTTTTTNPATQSISFFSYFPNTVTYSQNSYPTNMPTLSYSVNDTYDKQIDVLGASVLEATNVGGTTDAITLSMNHLLAQVNFEIKGEHAGLKYKVTKLTIGDALGNSGIFTYSSTNASTGAWTVTPDTKTYEYDANEFPADGYTSTLTTLKAAADGKALMLMPQSLGTTNYIKVTYSVTDDNDIELLASNERQVALSGSWDNGKKYVYTITLKDNLNPIEYTVDVSQWTDVTGSVDVK